MVVLALKLGVQHGTKVKEDLTVNPPQNLEKILSRARGFVKLEEDNSHFWGSMMRRESRKETSGRVEKDRSVTRDSNFHMQRGKVGDKIGLGKNEP